MSRPFFGRAWKIKLDTQYGDSVVLSSNEFEQPLRVVFDIEMRALLAYWQASVTLYNLSQGQSAQLLATGLPPSIAANQLWSFLQPAAMGDKVSISAGYKFGMDGSAFDPDANLLFEGNVFQPTWTIENVTDWKVVLRCCIGYQQDSLNFISFPQSAGKTALDLLGTIAKESKIPLLPIDPDASQVLSNTKLPRGQAIFEKPFQALRGIARDSKLNIYVSPHGINVRSFNFDPNTTPDITYTPPNPRTPLFQDSSDKGPVTKPTIIGVPVQTQDGVSLRVNLDGQVKIGSIIKVALGTAINQVQLQIGKLPAIPAVNGLYVVAGLKHFGDTRGTGNDWYTEITAMTAGFFPGFLGHNTPNVVTG